MLWQKSQSFAKDRFGIESTAQFEGLGAASDFKTDIADTSTKTETFESKQQKLKPKNQKKKEREVWTMEQELGFTDTMIEAVVERTKSSFLTTKEDVGSKKFETELKKNLENQMYSEILQILETGWLENNVKLLVGDKNTKGFIPKSDLIQMGKNIDQNFFAPYIGRFWDVDVVRKYVEKGWIPESSLEGKNLKAGVHVWGDINITPAKWKQFLNPPKIHPITGKTSNLKGTRKERIASTPSPAA